MIRQEMAYISYCLRKGYTVGEVEHEEYLAELWRRLERLSQRVTRLEGEVKRTKSAVRGTRTTESREDIETEAVHLDVA